MIHSLYIYMSHKLHIRMCMFDIYIYIYTYIYIYIYMYMYMYIQVGQVMLHGRTSTSHAWLPPCPSLLYALALKALCVCVWKRERERESVEVGWVIQHMRISLHLTHHSPVALDGCCAGCVCVFACVWEFYRPFLTRDFNDFLKRDHRFHFDFLKRDLAISVSF